MHRLAPLTLILAACQPVVVEGPGDPTSRVGYRHLDHTPPPEAVDLLRIMDDEIPVTALRVRDGCYAAFVGTEVIPVQRGGRQFCVG